MSTPAYFLGLDLGQASDYSALAILERQPRASKDEPPRYHCGELMRWQLKTPYPDIVADVATMLATDQLQGRVREFDRQSHGGYLSEIEDERKGAAPVLAIDATGVGAPVVDLFKKEFETGQRLRVVESYSNVSFSNAPIQLRSTPLPAPKKVEVSLRPIQITGGDTVTHEGGLHRVPKRDLVGAAQVALQTEQLKVASTLELAPVLVRELQNFQVKISLDTAHDSYGAWREGTHDDLVLAVCLALWIAENDKTRWMCWA